MCWAFVYAKGTKNWRRWCPEKKGGGDIDRKKTRIFARCATVQGLILVVLGQTMWA